MQNLKNFSVTPFLAESKFETETCLQAILIDGIEKEET
jgi:hypothetical protein